MREYDHVALKLAELHAQARVNRLLAFRRQARWARLLAIVRRLEGWVAARAATELDTAPRAESHPV